ncbi:hypothetical protein Clacol_001908 [Clathrus columnatus]|uniref:DNA replication factor Cdt1 C-terminal domain-containing protein n=1 Tax=Clathrus columnatus TaxID=1419009 RepID=A0AAV5A3B8_9AGAM|nr:hypothetical protein Clacol_001908 [Clathrus columnatus]
MEFVSPRKKRRTVDETFTTPKKLRTDSLISSLSNTNAATPFKSPSKHISNQNTTSASTTFPSHLARLLSIQTSLQHALSVGLATSAVAPCVDTGRVPNVLTHVSLTSAMGFNFTCEVDDLKRLCWLWEWDGLAFDVAETKETSQTRHLQTTESQGDEDDDNPFIDSASTRSSNNDNTDWTRGAMGFIITPTTHFIRNEGRRIPAYGIGIEVDIDFAEGKGGGMAAVARWTAEGEGRKKELEKKLKRWIQIQTKQDDTKDEDEDKETEIPFVPLASLPTLVKFSTKLSSLTTLLQSKSKGSTPLSTPSSRKLLTNTPSSRNAVRQFVFPTPKKNTLPFPSTPQTPIESPARSIKSFTDSPSIGNSTPRYRPRSISPTKSAGLSLLSRSIANQTADEQANLSVVLPNMDPTPKAKSASGHKLSNNIPHAPFLSFPSDAADEVERSGLSSGSNIESNQGDLIHEVSLDKVDKINKQTPPFSLPLAIPFPQTPSTRGRVIQVETPRSNIPGTPSSTHSNTTDTPRRAALYERIRLKSLSEETPSKSGPKRVVEDGGSMTREQLRLLGQEEMRRRVLLGRLDEVAATVWAAFSSPAQTSSTPLSVARKRRTMRRDEIVRVVVSSSRVPISAADAGDSVTLLMDLCPFFLQPLVIEGEEWVEMPASNPNSLITPPSPRRKDISGEEVRNRSPKSVRMEPKGGLREVRERIRRETEECSI